VTASAVIARVLADHPILTAYLYCDKPDCPAREVTILLKDHDREFSPTWVGAAPSCPICGNDLRLHCVKPL
jgi:hypothetical protein